VLPDDFQRMQSPGSILGFAGMKAVPARAPDIMTRGILGAARFAHSGGELPRTQFGVMHVWAHATISTFLTTTVPTIPTSNRVDRDIDIGDLRVRTNRASYF